MKSNTTDETELIGRNELGRFGPGNKCSANRSSRAAELKRAFVEAVTDSDVAEIARTLVRLAIDGDVQAARLVLDRCCGKPDAEPVVAVLLNQNASGGLQLRGGDPTEPETLAQKLADLDLRIARLNL